MLGRLFRYDFKASARDYLGVYLVLFIAALTTSFQKIQALRFIGDISMIVFMIVTIVTFIVMVISILRSFSRRIYSNEGYLNMTLPATMKTQLISKTLSSFCWMLITVVVLIVTLGLMALLNAPWTTWNFGEVWNAIGMIFSELRLFQFLPVGILGLISTMFYFILLLYIAVAIAHLGVLRRFRVLAGIISYFGIAFVFSKAAELFFRVINNIWPMINHSIDIDIHSWEEFTAFWQTSGAVEMTNRAAIMGWLGLLVIVIGTVLLFFATSYLLEKQLEIE